MNAVTVPSIQNIPLAKLQPSPRNVRKTGGQSTGDLVASIRSQGLLQPLVVRPAGDVFEVDAGGRRLRALKQIAAEDNLDDAEFKIPCTVLEPDESAEASLAENTIREAMHPADQADAFAKLATDGMSPGDIAARFGLADRTVQQRLKLAKVAPEIVEAYRRGELDLEQVEAFAIGDDQAEQLKYFKSALKQLRKGESPRDAWQLDERQIKQALTKGEIGPDDDRLKVVQLKDYEAAGGSVRRDLFGDENDGYVTDAKLLNRLAQEAVDRKAEEIKAAEGWSWCEGRVKWDHQVREKAGYEQLTDGWMAKSKFTDAEKARAGVIVSCSRGGFEIHRGMLNAAGVREQRKAEKEKQKSKPGAAKQTAEKKPMSDALMQRLTTARTVALQAELIAAPGVALIALAQALALEVLFSDRGDGDSLVRITPEPTFHDLTDETPAGAAVVKEHRALVDLLPKDPNSLFSYLSQNTDVLPRVLAYCTAVTVDWRLHYAAARVEESDELARAVSLDMTKWWKPTLANYLDHVSKDRVIEAVTETGNTVLPSRLAHMKSKPAAAEAEAALVGASWLPEILRIRATAPSVTAPAKKAKRS